MYACSVFFGLFIRVMVELLDATSEPIDDFEKHDVTFSFLIVLCRSFLSYHLLIKTCIIELIVQNFVS